MAATRWNFNFKRPFPHQQVSCDEPRAFLGLVPFVPLATTRLERDRVYNGSCTNAWNVSSSRRTHRQPAVRAMAHAMVRTDCVVLAACLQTISGSYNGSYNGSCRRISSGSCKGSYTEAQLYPPRVRTDRQWFVHWFVQADSQWFVQRLVQRFVRLFVHLQRCRLWRAYLTYGDSN